MKRVLLARTVGVVSFSLACLVLFAGVFQAQSFQIRDVDNTIISELYTGPPRPVVTILSPVENETVYDLFSIDGTVTSDGDPIVKVHITITPGTVDQDITAVTSFSYYWDTTRYPEDIATITIWAMDNKSHVSPNATVHVLVNNFNNNPQCTIISPSEGASLSGMQTVTGSFYDPDGNWTITNVSVNFGSGYIDAVITGSNSWEFLWDTVSVPDGSLLFYARAKDDLGSFSSPPDSMNYTINNANLEPSCSITSPANGSSVSGTVHISGTAKDTDGTIVEVIVDVSGFPIFPVDYNDITEQWSCNWISSASPDGAYIINATSKDDKGAFSPTQWVDVVKGAATLQPVINITSPLNGANVAGNINIQGLLNNPDGHDIDTIWLSLPDNTSSKEISWTYSGSGLSWNRMWDTNEGADGLREITVWCMDTHSHTSDTFTIYVNITNNITIPKCSITVPAKGTVVRSVIQQISGSTIKGDAPVTTVSVSTGGGSWSTFPIGIGSDWTFNWNTTGTPEGTVNIYAHATDTNGVNSTDAYVGVILYKNDKPKTSITSHSNNAVVSGSSITFSGTASDPDGISGISLVQISIDSGSWNNATQKTPPSWSDWQYSWSTTGLPRGTSHSISVRAIDNESVFSDLSTINIYLINAVPSCKITSPTNGSVLKWTATIKGTALDPDGTGDLDFVRVRMGSGSWVPATGTSSWTCSINTTSVNNGLITVFAEAIDQNGTVSLAFFINVDIQNPSGTEHIPDCTISFPITGSVLSGTVKIKGTSSDVDGNITIKTVEVKIGLSAWILANGKTAWDYDWDTTKAPNGPYNISARAYDGDGYSNIVSVPIQVNNVFADAGDIKGRVIDGVTGNGISAQISGPGWPTPAYTDLNGNFTVLGLKSGTYTLTAASSGYYNTSADVTVLADKTSTPAFKLYFISRIIGKVLDNKTGSPIQDAIIFINNRTYQTQVDGSYAIDLPQGTYKMVVTKKGYRTIDFTITLPKDPVDPKLRMDPENGGSASISQMVMDNLILIVGLILIILVLLLLILFFLTRMRKATKDKAALKEDAMREKILGIVKANPGCTTRLIANEANMEQMTVEKQTTKLVTSGDLVQQSGVKGGAAIYYVKGAYPPKERKCEKCGKMFAASAVECTFCGGTGVIREPMAIDEVFLLYNDGRLIRHETRRLKPDMDNDILASMLVAIQSFIKDSFRGEPGALDQLKFGELTMQVGRGRYIIIAVLIMGQTNEDISKQIVRAIQEIEKNYGEILNNWNGVMEDVEPLHGYIKALINGKYR